MTIEIPDNLAARLEPERSHLVEIIERGLRHHWSEASGLRREVISFLARGPQPGEIIAFKLSAAVVEHVRELLERSKAGNLRLPESAELEVIAELDEMVSMIKAESRVHLRSAS